MLSKPYSLKHKILVTQKVLPKDNQSVNEECKQTKFNCRPFKSCCYG